MHEKCPHPSGSVERFGGRRRRCRVCGRTWSVHTRQRGRKRVRVSTQLLSRLLVDGVPTSQLARSYGCSRWTLQKRCQAAIRRLAARPYLPVMPDGQLVLIADALRLKLQGREYALYDMAVKPTDRNTAFFLEPVLLEGHESAHGWRQAISGIMLSVRQRIAALVSDGFPGTDSICDEYGWIQQRCHWHMLMMFGGSLKPQRRSRKLLRRIRDLACRVAWLVLHTTDQERLDVALGVLTTLVPMVPHRARRLPGVIRQFIADSDLGRAYLTMPQLGLPTTTAVLESLHGRIRTVAQRTHSPEAIQRRASCLVRLAPTSRCNPGYHQQN